MNYWKRYISFTIGKREYKAPFVLKFNAEFSMKGRGNTRAYIYNPSDETIENVVPRKGENQQIIIDAGYEEDHGICIIGEICSYKVTKAGLERVLEMTISDSATKLSSIKISKTWNRGVKASAVLKDIVSMSGIDSAKIELDNDKIYPRGLSLNTTLHNALNQMMRDTGSDYFLRNGKLYFQPKNDQGIKTGILLSSATGLIDRPEILSVKKDGKYVNQGSVKSLFNYRIGPGEHIRVEAESFRGNCKVTKGSHSFSDDDANTVMEVVQL
jgi:hypothetical protein